MKQAWTISLMINNRKCFNRSFIFSISSPKKTRTTVVYVNQVEVNLIKFYSNHVTQKQGTDSTFVIQFFTQS